MVETALVLPFVLLLVFGVFEFGRIVFVFSAVNNASREAARFGAATGATLGGVPRYLNCNAIRQAAIDTAFLAGLTPADVQIQYDAPAGQTMQVYGYCDGGSARDINNNNFLTAGDVSPGDRVVVTVARQIDPILSIFPSFNPSFVTARTILKEIAIGPPECDDGVDNDGDGATDHDGGDSGCTSPDDTTEAVCYRLSIVPLPEDGGAMSLDPGTNCSNRYIEETTVQIEAFADIRNDPSLRPRYTFDYWEGPINSADVSANPTTVTMNADKDVIAHFRRVAADLEVTKTGSPDPVASGKPLSYHITVNNPYTDTAHNLVLTDTLPSDVDYQGVWSSSEGTAVCNEVTADTTIVCTWDSQSSPGLVTFDFEMLAPVANYNPLTITNTVTVGALEYDPDLSDNTDIVLGTVYPRAELSITKEGPDGTVIANTPYDYTITVSNSGPSVATGVEVRDPLPNGVNFVSSDDGCNNDDDPRVVICPLGELSAGAVRSVVFTVVAPRNGGTIDNTAFVESNEDVFGTEENTENNEADDESGTVVLSRSNLVLDKTGPASATRDVDFNYSLLVTNNGPSDALGVSVVDTLPTGVQFNHTVAGSDGTCGDSGGTVTCTLGDIPDGESRTVIFNVTPIVAGSATNTATVDSSITDPNDTNNTDTATTEVTTNVSLNVTKTATASTVDEGDPFSYSIQVSNSGPSTATSVELVDVLPPGVTYLGNIDPGTWSCEDDSAPTIRCWPLNNQLLAGQGTTIVINVQASDNGTISNTATLNSAEGSVSSSVDVSASSALDLSLSVNAPMTATVDTAFTYHLNIANSGPSDATGAQVDSNLHPNVAFFNVVSPSGWTCNYDPDNLNIHVVRCTATGPFAPGNATISIRVTPQSAGSIFNEGVITADQSDVDSNPANDSDSSTTMVE